MSAKNRVSETLRVVREDRMFAHKVERAGKGKGAYTRKGRRSKIVDE
jgi:stalled ribosome alternative rescue factor ArfA